MLQNLINKCDIIDLYIQLQKECDEGLARLMSQVENLSRRFQKLESALVVSKNVNSVLEDRVVTLECNLHATEQYWRREYLEIVGIPVNMEQKNLQETVINILSNIEVEYTSTDTEACHQIGNKGETHVKFSSCRTINKIKTTKSKLKDLDAKKINF